MIFLIFDFCPNFFDATVIKKSIDFEPRPCITDGMIMFPSSGVFADFGGVGVSMFFVT